MTTPRFALQPGTTIPTSDTDALITVRIDPPLDGSSQLDLDFRPNDNAGGTIRDLPYQLSKAKDQLFVELPRVGGALTIHPHGDGSSTETLTVGASIVTRSNNQFATGPSGPSHPISGGTGPGGTPPGGGSGVEPPTVVRLERTAADAVKGELLWSVIRHINDALAFPRFSRFIDLAFSDDPRGVLESGVKDALLAPNGLLAEPGPFFRVDSYERLKVASEIFLLANASAFPPTNLSLVDRSSDNVDIPLYTSPGDTLPYLQIVFDRLGIAAPKLTNPTSDAAKSAREVLERKSRQPAFIELIWSYWHEEGMQVQAMAAISQRFQNLRSPGTRDPLAGLEIDPLRPLSHLLWRHTQGEGDRLSVLRRAHEYEHEYGFTLHGKAVAALRPAERRSKFLEAFHNLLFRAVKFYKEDDDTTHVADGFPVLNALKETHYVLSRGAHNQFGDLPVIARQEMLIEQYLLARPEMREFLGSRPMVAYREPWMDRVDNVKTLKGWTDVSVVHFHDLAVFGEQLLLSIRWDAWSVIDDPAAGKAWARFWRPEIQGYVHALRATIGVDLSVEPTSSTEETERYLPPSVHLLRRLSAQASSVR